MKQTWATFFERPHVAAALGPGATPVDRHLAWPIPARIDTATLSHGPVLFAGDAAAATDVMTGEGIGQALLTGRLAAEAIVAGGDVGRPVPPRRARRAGGRPPHVGAPRPGARRRRGADGAIAILAHAGDWGRRNFARWMFEDEPRAIALTPRRWHRRFLRRPGVVAPPRP